MEDFYQEKKYQRAKERVEEIKGAYYHLFSYLGVLTFLAILNYTIDRWDNPWFLWVAFGWGIGLIIHLLFVINWSPFLGKNWEERKIKEFMEEDYKSEHNYK